MANLTPEAVAGGELDTQQMTASIAPTGVDANGNPIPVPVSSLANLAWTNDASGVVIITPSADNSSCNFAAGVDGVGVVTTTANNSNGDLMTLVWTITVTAGAIVATKFNGSLSTPVAK
jgi:hypothetical protein